MSKKVLGVDIGNVIINNRIIPKDRKLISEQEYSEQPVIVGAFEALKELNKRFAGEVYLVSKCTEWAETQVMQWLSSHNFFEITGIKKANIRFCRERSEKEKKCESLGINYFIDDRLEVLGHMINRAEKLYLFCPDAEEVKQFEMFLKDVTVINSWNEVLEIIS